jgi:malate synthase
MSMDAEFVQTLVRQLTDQNEQLVEKDQELAKKVREIKSLEKIIKDLRATARFSGRGSYR